MVNEKRTTPKMPMKPVVIGAPNSIRFLISSDPLDEEKLKGPSFTTLAAA